MEFSKILAITLVLVVGGAMAQGPIPIPFIGGGQIGGLPGLPFGGGGGYGGHLPGIPAMPGLNNLLGQRLPFEQISGPYVSSSIGPVFRSSGPFGGLGQPFSNSPLGGIMGVPLAMLAMG